MLLLCNSNQTGGGGGSWSASITSGSASAGTAGTHTFALNTCTVTGGVGPFTYLWSNTNDGFGTWNTGGTAATFTPHVGGMAGSDDTSVATYICTVTDTGAGSVMVISNNAVYQYTNSSYFI